MKIEIDVPDGVSGDWRVESFTVSEEEAVLSRMRACFRREVPVPAGNYKRLMRGNTVVMSNTPMEINTHRGFIHRAKGHVLINGLGLGMALKAILLKPEVISVVIVEKSADVIKLVAPTFINDQRVTILYADAYQHKPPKEAKYDVIWHDIWDDICSDNLPEMTKLHRKYARKTIWQDSWAKQECKNQR